MIPTDDEPPIYISEYLAKVQKLFGQPRPGMIYEVLIDPEWDEINMWNRGCTVDEFVADWRYLMEPFDAWNRPSSRYAYMGVVHPDGVVMVPFPAEPKPESA